MMRAKRIWVTGAAGFIGSSLTRRLTLEGALVTQFGREGSNLVPLNRVGMASAIEEGLPSKIFHLAGGSTVTSSIVDPLRDFYSNVTATADLLEFVRIFCPAAPIVMASSAAVYGSEHQSPIDLKASLKPVSPYGYHKVMAEDLAASFARQFGLRIAIARLFSIYGEGLRKQLVFDLCCRIARDEAPLILGGSGMELRDWCHVEDTIRGLTTLPIPTEGTVTIHNLGTSQATDVATVASHVLHSWGRADAPQFTGVTRVGDPFSLVASKDSLPPNFFPEIEVATGLKNTVAWFRSHRRA